MKKVIQSKTKIKILTNEEVYDEKTSLAQSILASYGRLDSGKRSWFVVFNDVSEWVAFGGYREIDEERVYFGPTYVKEEYRGMGLQKRLIRARLDKAKEDGYQEAISSIYTYNYISGNNLIACGFKMIRIPAYYDPNETEVWFSKTL